MRAAESNNITLIKELCHENHSEHVNMTDDFGWTPLMSACYAGAYEAVELFLQLKADVTIKNKKGSNCFDLAKSKKHLTILKLLNEYLYDKYTVSKTDENSSKRKITPSLNFFCKTCKQNITDVSVSKHESSIMHLFSSTSKSKVPTSYGIPESNRGFQILLKSGWDRDKGLGPDGCGQKFPPKTILKQDKTGLGAKDYIPRVTHVIDSCTKEQKIRHSVRSSLRKEKRNEKLLERKLRQILS
uniref:G-patch domain-containing protein n=1 Tax=Clastoptera arizonana TaxID=38151 RepID=A0A1B6CLE5_9HEMI